MGKADLAFEKAVSWQCPRCLNVLDTKESMPRCPRCGLRESPS